MRQQMKKQFNNAGLRIVKCEHTGCEVLYDAIHDICLHNDTVVQDKAEVRRFKRSNRK